jgi:hypothetical protein
LSVTISKNWIIYFFSFLLFLSHSFLLVFLYCTPLPTSYSNTSGTQATTRLQHYSGVAVALLLRSGGFTVAQCGQPTSTCSSATHFSAYRLPHERNQTEHLPVKHQIPKREAKQGKPNPTQPLSSRANNHTSLERRHGKAEASRRKRLVM